MKEWIKFLFFYILFFSCMSIHAYANIAPLKIVDNGVEPVINPGVKIDSAAITVMPYNTGFKFTCNYSLIGQSDIDSLVIGIPEDMGYALEAGYIANLNIFINGSAAESKVYNTAGNLSDTWKQYGSLHNFKWHAFTVPVKKDEKINLYITYDMLLKAVEQDDTNNCYHIVPFILSTDKLFGKAGSYKVKYINDEYISLSDVRVMINSMVEPDITSKAILSPKWNDTQLLWDLKDPKDFQNFRLIVLSYRKLAMGFTTNTVADHSIRWAVLNNNYQRLAEIFEDIAKDNTEMKLSSEDRGTAAYLASEFYFRLNKYDKALEMLSPAYRTILWPSSIKYEYVNAVKHKEQKDYYLLVNDLNSLSNYKDYVLLSSFAQNEIVPAVCTLASQAAEESSLDYKKTEHKNYYNLYISDTILIFVTISIYLFYSRIKK